MNRVPRLAMATIFGMPAPLAGNAQDIKVGTVFGFAGAKESIELNVAKPAEMAAEEIS